MPSSSSSSSAPSSSLNSPSSSEVDGNYTDPPCIERSLFTFDGLATFQSIMDHSLFAGCLISTFLSFFVIRMAVRHIRRGSCEKCLHVFLISMTSGDLLLTALCYPLEFVTRWEIFSVPRSLNIIVHFVTWVALSGSSVSLILLNLEKLLFFRYPLRYNAYVTRRRGITIIVITWAVCFIFVSVAWFIGCFVCMDASCSTLSLLPDKKYMYLLFSFSVCILPTLTSLAVAFYILKVVKTQNKRLAEEQALYNNGDRSSSPHQNPRQKHSKLRVFYFIFMTTLFTAATLLPFRLYQLKAKFLSDPLPTGAKKECSTFYGMWIMLYLVSLNAILNPFITVTVLPQYRCRILDRLRGRNANDTRMTDV